MRGGETTILVSPPRDKSSTVRWPFHGVIILAPRGNSSTARSVFLWDSRYSAIFGYRAVEEQPRGGRVTARWKNSRAVGAIMRGSLGPFRVGLVRLTRTMVLLVFCVFAFAGIDRQPLIRQ